MKIGLVFVVLLLPFISFSQKNETRKAGFHSIAAGGVTVGEMEVKLFGHASGGVTYDRYFTGLGVGYDSYRFNTIPVFIDWRMDFDRKRVLFVYIQGGYNIPTDSKKIVNTFQTNSMRGGFYSDLGMGVRFRIGASNQVLLSGGFSSKRVSELREFDYASLCPNGGRCSDYNRVFTYNYNFGRIIIKVGWEFGE